MIGVDIVYIPRIERLYNRFGSRFEQRFFSECEVMNSKSRGGLLAAYYAKRFAAKEAFLKAIGCGMRAPLKFREMQVINCPLGKPRLELLGDTLCFFKENFHKTIIHVSVSDERDLAVAFVMLQPDLHS